MPVPRCAKDWKHCAASFVEEGKRQGIFVEAGYYATWLVRTYLIAFMRYHKVFRLPLDGVSKSDFAALAPDQKGWVQRLCTRNHSPETSLRYLRYHGPPELFSMWACIFSDPDLVGVSPEAITERSSQMRQALLRYQRCHGLPPHPVVLLREIGLLGATRSRCPTSGTCSQTSGPTF
jgi:hypothetical protein